MCIIIKILERSGKKEYIEKHGWHFNEKLCAYAVSQMMKTNASTGAKEKIKPLDLGAVEAMLTKHGIKLKHDNPYDSVFVANMGVADYLESSIPDEKHLAMYIRDVIDDPDAKEGTILRKWLATEDKIDWEEFM